MSFRWSRSVLMGLTLILLAAPGARVARGEPRLEPLPSAAPKINAAQAELGRLLFFDVRLSGDVAISCSSCHDPEAAWGDPKPLADAYPGSLYFRNSKSLLNVAHNELFFWDGRMGGDDMASQVRDQITETHFLNLDGRIMQERLAQVPEYVALFKKGFGAEPSFGRTLNAVAAFEKTLVTKNAPVDRYLRGNTGALSAEAKRGKDLFEGKAGCVGCHHGPMLTDWQAHNLGVAENPDVVADPLRHITLHSVTKFLGVPNWQNLSTDPGVFAVTKDEADRGAFITPTLREVARTAPYMHNGTIGTLAEVVEFYDAGGGPGSGKDAALKPLGLSAADKNDLVAFLGALSGQLPAIEVPKSLPEYGVVALGGPGGNLEDLVRPDLEVDEPPSTLPLGPLPETPPIPADNPMSDAKVELGKMLFFDTRLGGDASVACSTCHDPAMAWGEGSDVSRGYPGTVHWRNSQTIVNSAYLSKLFWAGAAPSLEKQAPSAAKGGVAGNGENDMMEARLLHVPDYVRRFREVFGTQWPTINDAWKAIAAFERTLVQPDTPFDQYMRGDDDALSPEAKRGLALFKGKAACSACHSGPMFTDERYHRLGVPENPVFEEDPLRQITFRFEQYAKGVHEDMYRKVRTDLGLYYRTKRKEHIGKFRTPSLRYTKYSLPFMHNGMFFTLEEVVDFYDQGGGDVPAKSSLLRPLGLTDQEKADLVTFIESLSGPELIVEAPELPDYEVMN